MILIPFDPTSSANQEFKIRLGSEMATILLRWNPRAGFWGITVTNEAQDTLKAMKVVPNWPLMREYNGSQPISGDFIVLPLSSTAIEPVDYDQLGVDWGIFWATDSEVLEWEEDNGLG